MSNYIPVIGLEVHAQLLTKSKAFSSDSTEFGALPNQNISVVTLGHPGTLPVPNKKHFEYAMRMGLACGSSITEKTIFARKNYFYPDLPKGYQISQDKTPLCVGGSVHIELEDETEKEIGITRIHIEEDSGKSTHIPSEEDTLVDFNRAGVPLIEIVSEPDLRSAQEAYNYLQEIRRLVRYLEICDGNMEEGSLRADVNVSVMKVGADQFGSKVEVKNMNSFKNVARAIDYEVERQIDVLESGGTVATETRNFDAVSGKTFSMRVKESMNDYRYFPEPDLQPVIADEKWIKRIKNNLPPLPRALRFKFMEEYGLPKYDAEVLTDDKATALYFQEICDGTKHYKSASNVVMGPVKSYLNERTLHIEDFPLSPSDIIQFVELLESGKVSKSIAIQRIFPEYIHRPEEDPLKIAEELDLIQESDEGSLQPIVEEVLGNFPDKVEEYRNGKKGLHGMFMGQIMKATQGKADPKMANKLLSEALNNGSA